MVIEEVEKIFGKNVSELVRRSNMLNDLGIIKLLERMEELIETPKYSHLDLYNKVQNELKKINKEEPPRIVQTEAPLKTEEPETILISASDGKPAKAITKEIVEKIENAPSHTDDY